MLKGRLRRHMRQLRLGGPPRVMCRVSSLEVLMLVFRLCPVVCGVLARPPLDQLATHVLCCARRGCGLACCALS